MNKNKKKEKELGVSSWHNGLRIQHCHYSGSGHGCGIGLFNFCPGNFCMPCGKKGRKEREGVREGGKKKGRERKREGERKDGRKEGGKRNGQKQRTFTPGCTEWLPLSCRPEGTAELLITSCKNSTKYIQILSFVSWRF